MAVSSTMGGAGEMDDSIETAADEVARLWRCAWSLGNSYGGESDL